jgi:hypothetical protein
VVLYWVPEHAGARGNETADRLARSDSASGFVGPESALGVSKRDLSSKGEFTLVHSGCASKMINPQ